MTKQYLLFAVIFLTLLSFLEAVETRRNKQWFFKGRLRDGGFLGHLGRSSKLLASGNRDVEHWFRQRLTHFEPADDREWSQRYFVNSENYKEGR